MTEFELKDLLFTRYGDPFLILKTYKVRDLGVFLVQLIDKVREEAVERIYFNSDLDISLHEFKKQYHVKMYKSNKELKITEKQEKTQKELASMFITDIRDINN